MAKRNKKALVCGKPGTYSRGGKFFVDLSRAFARELPDMIAGPGMLNDVQNVDTMDAAAMPYVNGESGKKDFIHHNYHLRRNKQENQHISRWSVIYQSEFTTL